VDSLSYRGVGRDHAFSKRRKWLCGAVLWREKAPSGGDRLSAQPQPFTQTLALRVLTLECQSRRTHCLLKSKR